MNNTGNNNIIDLMQNRGLYEIHPVIFDHTTILFFG